MRHLNLFLLTTILFFACQDKKKDAIIHLVSEWQGKEILFPNNTLYINSTTDTVNLKTNNFPYKVLIYVDSAGCTSCKLQLIRWKELIEHTDSLTGGSLSYFFYIHAKDYEETLYLLKRDNFNYPVYIDQEDSLNKLNKFPSNIMFQTFLLDRDNKVNVIGNPVHNPAVKELYLKQIGQTELSKQPLTDAIAEEAEINIGNIVEGNSKETVFTLKNTGNHPLVILDAATTCGCVSPSFDKHAADPGKSLQVRVKITPQDKGLFNETIIIKCNTKQQIKLFIKGDCEEKTH